MNIRIKICGVTRLADALTAARLGADAIGLNFYDRSPRWVKEKTAEEIIFMLPADVTPVAVLVQPIRNQVTLLRRSLGFAWFQLHDADLSRTAAELLGVPFILAHGVSGREDLNELRLKLDEWRMAGVSPQAVLVDAKVPGLHGGTGKRAPWELLADLDVGLPLILAGGLTPENVAEAIRLVRPYGVDVAGGVETSPGLKDEEKIRRFIENARSAAAELR